MEEDNVNVKNETDEDVESVPSINKPNFGNIVRIIPKMQVKDKNIKFNITYRKEPKFVPYEPYKAAVNPMIQPKLIRNEKSMHKDIVNNLPSINNLSLKENNEFNSQSFPESSNHRLKESSLSWDQEKQLLQTELSRLKEENYELENQLKFQAQVNGELKKLLVAAVGEDIEVRVQLLTQDKLHLATELLRTAKCLSTHQEQIEWLAGHSEVWRSKFLASSCLVEDLAKWKAGLSQKVTECKDALKNLLGEISKIKGDVNDTNCKLSVLYKSFNLNGEYCDNDEFKGPNIVDKCSSNHKLVDRLMAQLLGKDNSSSDSDVCNDELLTDAEKCAIQLINQPLISLEQTEIACNAVMMGASIALTASSPHCSHCNGIVKTI